MAFVVVWVLLAFLRTPFVHSSLPHSCYIPYTSHLSESRSYLTTNNQSASLPWCQATIRARDKFFFLEIFLRQLRVCYFMAPCLTRGQVCNLLLPLGLAVAVPLCSESRGTQTIFYCPNF
jgi:hypothetical protein